MALAPIPASERIAALDVLRGLALYGVLTANLVYFYSGLRYLPDYQAHVGPVTSFFMTTFVSARAISTLTILFGVGFTVQLARADERGSDGRRLFVRRMLVMGLFGSAHLLLLWWGDILWEYALVGLTLVWFRRWSPRALLFLGLALIVVPHVVWSVPAIHDAIRSAAPHPPDGKAFNAEVLAALTGADRVAMTGAHLRFLFYFEAPIAVWFLPWILGHFLVGMAAGKARVFASDGGHRRRMFRRLLATGIAIVIANAAVTLLSGGRQPEGVPAIARVGLTVLGELSTLAMVAVYMSAVALLMQRRRARSGLMLLAPTGRMPLTTYLMQSLVATFVFYGWGLGWIGAIDAAGCVAIATGIFVTQVVIAHLWLRRYRSGPLEWLWRRLVYGATPTPTPM